MTTIAAEFDGNVLDSDVKPGKGSLLNKLPVSRKRLPFSFISRNTKEDEMKTSSKEKREILENIKSCIRELNLPILGEEQEGETVSIFSKVELEMFSMNIEAKHFAEQEIIVIDIEFSHAVHQEKLEKIYDLLNRINNRLMDIGTFSVWPPTGEISVRAGIHVPGQILNSEQFRKSLERLLDHGFACYGLIVRADVTNASPGEVIEDFIGQVEHCARRRVDTLGSFDAKDLH
jgi:hypothetical protein